jgi:hypothetical protein
VLISAAVCPHPPILVPELAAEAAPELDGLRAACRRAIGRLLGDDVPVVVVGGGPETRAFGPTGSGSLSAYGLDATYGPDKPEMPLSLTIGRYLLAEFSPSAFQSIAFDATPEECLALGRSLAAQADRVALLVMGDGSACRDEKAPGYLDVRAGPYDQEVARALGEADAATLGSLDPVLAQELQVAGRAAWQVLAGAAGETRLTGELLADEAPYGVGYLVASWRLGVRVRLLGGPGGGVLGGLLGRVYLPLVLPAGLLVDHVAGLVDRRTGLVGVLAEQIRDLLDERHQCPPILDGGASRPPYIRTSTQQETR